MEANLDANSNKDQNALHGAGHQDAQIATSLFRDALIDIEATICAIRENEGFDQSSNARDWAEAAAEQLEDGIAALDSVVAPFVRESALWHEMGDSRPLYPGSALTVGDVRRVTFMKSRRILMGTQATKAPDDLDAELAAGMIRNREATAVVENWLSGFGEPSLQLSQMQKDWLVIGIAAAIQRGQGSKP